MGNMCHTYDLSIISHFMLHRLSTLPETLHVLSEGRRQQYRVIHHIRKTILAAVTAVSAICSSFPANAEDVSGKPELHGQVSLSTPYLSTTYRKGGSFKLQLNGSKLGYIAPSVTATVLTNNANTIFPTAQVNATSTIGPVSVVASAGVQGFLAGLDNPKIKDTFVVPFVSSSVSLPLSVSINAERTNALMVTPSLHYLRYLRGNDISLKIDDKNGDGKPDFTRPVQQFYFGATAGATFDKNFINTSIFCDPIDPTIKPGAISIWGSLNAGRNF